MEADAVVSRGKHEKMWIMVEKVMVRTRGRGGEVAGLLLQSKLRQ